ncbi:MAG: EI24 domain-containing protein [Pseudolysinimonas sp.]|uniref:EI24 domain-containing protein n=1 Tax=Pseudolysinimonas sp. TaxID=2680009 RepID=UPI0032666E69
MSSRSPSASPVPAPSGRPPRAGAEFALGFATLARGFALWRRAPRVMWLGLIPAALVFAVLLALLVFLAANLMAVAAFLTPFADGWSESPRTLFRILLGLAMIIGLVLLFAFTFTGLTLFVGDWFYEKIWRAVEQEYGEFVPSHEPGFWRSNLDAVSLSVRAILTGILLAVIGLIPVVGTIASVVLGLFLSGRLVAIELTTRPLEARGLTRVQRRDLLRTRSPRVLGFGVAVHLCFLVPLGAIVVMPAAVAGATILAKHAMGEREIRPIQSRPNSD